MRYPSVLFTLVAPLLSSAAPARFMGKRAAADVLVLKFADVLEQLENDFYSQAISKFQDSDFTTAGFSSSRIPIEQFQNIQSDEALHSQTLQAALKSLGETPITGCNFDFSSVLTDVSTMAATARVVENVGVSAYLGGATLLTDPVLLDAAGSILTTEARHQTILNVLSGTGTAIPASFDIPFTPSEVLAIASPFMSGCNIPIPSNTPLSVTNTGTVAPGTLLTFKASTLNGTIPDSSMFCQMLVGGASTSISLPFSQCVVPPGINGPVALFITSDNQTLINNVRDRAQDKIVAGPTVAFIDTKPESLGQLVRIGSDSTSQSTSTLTISPSQASSIISSAGGATGTAIAPSPSSASTSSSSSGPNLTTGPAENGAIIVNGWSDSSSSSVSNLGNDISTGVNVTSAGGVSATGSASATFAPSASSSISAQASATASSSASPTGSGGIVVNGWSSGGGNVASASASGASVTSSAAAAGATSSSISASGGGNNNSASPSANGVVVNSSSS